MVSIELFNYHMLYDVTEDSSVPHRYVYALPYYDSLYVGRHIYPSGVKMYEITSEVYIDLLLRKQKSRKDCQRYVETEIDTQLIASKQVVGYRYLGDKKDLHGSLASVALQLLFSEGNCSQESIYDNTDKT